MESVRGLSGPKPQISLQELALNTPYRYQLSEQVDWVGELLEELNQEVEGREREQMSSFLSLNLEFTRRNQDNLQDYFTLTGDIDAQYITRCVRTYEVMEEIQRTPINAMLIAEQCQQEMGLQDETAYFIDNREWDLFTYDFQVNLLEIIHEYIYLNKNPYPSLKRSGDDLF